MAKIEERGDLVKNSSYCFQKKATAAILPSEVVDNSSREPVI